MNNLLKINIHDMKKGKFENVVYANNSRRLYHAFGYSLNSQIYDFESQDDISNIIEIRLPISEARKVLEQLGFDYNTLITEAINSL